MYFLINLDMLVKNKRYVIASKECILVTLGLISSPQGFTNVLQYHRSNNGVRGVNKAAETYNSRNHLHYSGWIIYDACYLWPYTAGLRKHRSVMLTSKLTVFSTVQQTWVLYTQQPPRTPLDKAQSGVRAASSLLFKQTGAYSNPCFLSPRLVSKVTCQKRQELCWLPPRGQFPSFAQVCLTFGHMTPVPMTTRLRTAWEHVNEGSSTRFVENEDGIEIGLYPWGPSISHAA